ncbi:hypothetical protein Pfo_021344 [Paulownia fortunei]|nr:hypothetical protein Pfo_021344 [Paulownia fortunei]
MAFHATNMIFLISTWLIMISSTSDKSNQLINPACEESCGEEKIPYPFGTKLGCFLNKNFFVTCNHTSNPPTPYWGTFQVLDISANDGQMRILTSIATDCYTSSGGKSNASSFSLVTTLPYFHFSHTRNRFTGLGCDTYAVFRDPNHMTGCMSLCTGEESVTGGVCSGAGCCQTSIPKGLLEIQLIVGSYSNHTTVWDFNPCSFSFLAADDLYNFSISDLKNYDLRGKNVVPTVVDWSVGDQSCEEEARKDPTGYACRDPNSYCNNSDNGRGYRCHCSSGYQGNPYLPHGCQDIDECSDPKLNDCTDNCINTLGGYSCFESSDQLLGIDISVGIGVGLFVLITASSFLYLGSKKRKLIKLKEKFFKQNGGFLLQELIAQREISPNLIKIFTAEELEISTKKYDNSLIIGQGGYGTVYKGILPNGSLVAIKKSKQTDIYIEEEQIKQFISEVIVLCQVNHRNVVRLLGCCLETPSPILIYEFIINGTLSEHLHHDHNGQSSRAVPLETRLKIAAQTAGVLSYLHSQAFTPIIHRDIKSTNILLDENLDAKMQIYTVVQGTLGYLDPEYLQTSQLTEKSDVYSFGVVLVELLTRQKAVRFNRPEEERSLAKYFLSALQENQLNWVLDDHIVEEGNVGLLKQVADIARRCLSLKMDERPNMKQVAMELEGLRNMEVARDDTWIGIELNLEEETFA